MATHRDDDKGYKRGARGIDGNHGENFVKWGKPEGICKVTGSDGGPSTHGVKELQKRAVGGQRKIGG